MWENVNCNLCGSKKRRIIAQVRFSPLGGTSQLVKCKECGLNYITPRYIVKDEKNFYIQEYHELHTDDLWQKNREPIFRLYLNKINKLCPAKGNLLDIGCGKGFFIKFAESNGWSVYGVDISKSALKYAREKLQLNIFEGELKDAHFPKNYFEVITLFNVLDQLYNPYETLKEIYNIMDSGGLLILRIVNVDFHLFLHYIFNKFSKILYKDPAVFHLYMFSPLTIKKILKENGFHRIKVLNAQLDPHLESLRPYFNRKLACLFKNIIYASVQIIFFISGGKWVWGPSLTVLARKP